MRLFLTLCTLVAVANAKPQYNYGTGASAGSFGSSNGGYSGGTLLGAPSQQTSFSSSHGPADHSGGVSSGFLSGSSYGPSTGGQSGFSSGPLTSSSGSGFSTGGLAGLSSGGNQGVSGGGFSGFSSSGSSGPGYSPNVIGGSFGGFNSGSSSFNSHSQSSQATTHEAPLVHKQFITITAPEDSSSLEQTKHLVLGRAQKNYRVIFIKAASSNSANVKLSAEYAPKEEKTVIYVLTKKDSSLEINDIATPAPTQPSKPEIYFIKYKSEQEAQHAQREIQAQYDTIEGTSEHVDGGVAQEKSVVGILDGGNIGGGHVDQGGLQQTSSTQFGTNSVALEHSGSSGSSNKATAYLPPSK